MCGVAIYVKERLSFAYDFSLANSENSYFYFRLTKLHSVSYFFFLYQWPSSSLCTVCEAISPITDEVFSINPSSNIFLFREFKVNHKDWLNYFVGGDKPGELCFIFSQTTLPQWSTFPNWTPDCDSHWLTLLNLFLLILVFVPLCQSLL